jgi:hypothetical protein
MSKVTHGECSHPDTKIEEGSFEAKPFNLIATYPTMHP